VFIQHSDVPGFEKIDWRSREKEVSAYAVLLFLSVMLAFCMIICIRHSLLKMFAKLDQDAFTPSDYCIMGHSMQFESYHPKEIEAKVKEVFCAKYDMEEDDIVYVNPCFDIGDFYKLSEKYNNLMKEKGIVDAYKEEHKLDEEGYKAHSTGDEFYADGFPKKGAGLCSSGEAISEEELKKNIEEVEGEIEEITN
jgi:hypothetical protein